MPRATLTLLLLIACAAALAPGVARGEWTRPTFELHGFGELQLRTYGTNYHPDYFVPSQWAHVLNLELESDLAPDGLGPFDLISAFVRVEVRYDCIYNGCGFADTDRWWGNSAERAPRNLAGGKTSPYTGQIDVSAFDPPERVQRDNRLGNYQIAIPALRDLIDLGATGVTSTFAPVDDALFTVKGIDATLGNGTFTMGPWNLDARIDEVGALETIPNPTLPLPLRPAVPPPNDDGSRTQPHGLFVPSYGFRRLQGRFDDPEQSQSQEDLTWNHGQSQDERELKEAYLDFELFEGRLWIRAGKQSIVWGKTELFRTTDQFNPQDLALSSLPSLEESRISLWSARGTWSFYDVGPLEDVRLELAFNYDEFEPLDLGRCGEPYTIWLVCAKTFGLWAHGVAGNGVAGEIRPPNPWDTDNGLEGIEFGARLEWRWNRFSFQLSDFYGYEDAPVADFFYPYERKVDPLTGQPLDARGKPLTPDLPPDEILAVHPGNRQLFDLVCSVTVGIAGDVLPPVAENCLLDLLNSQEEILPGATPALALGAVFGGNTAGVAVIGQLAGLLPDLVELNTDPNDGPQTGGLFGSIPLSGYLTNEQEALLGCGPFYGTDCDVDGIDLFNTEASILVQSFPQFEPGGAVATREVKNLPSPLPGARGPTQDINRNGIVDLVDPAIPDALRYSPYVDGCVGPGVPGCENATPLINPDTGELFENEMGALSYNFLVLLVALGAGGGNDPDCTLEEPLRCEFVRGVFGIAGSTRPEIRAGGNGVYGRRDFVWHGGSEIAIQYEKRNVLGFAFDFAEDHSKTNWSVEATWFHNQPWGVVDRVQGWDKTDTFNLTLSVDRPTFINFLNPGRTFFMNSQWFIRYIHGYRGDGFVADGPVSALGTLSIITGYHQDRLLPSLTLVHDIASNSGGVIGQVTFRFNTDFSATFGLANFYGDPSALATTLRQPIPQNLGGNYKADTRYNGLTPLAERDEIYLLLRYTF